MRKLVILLLLPLLQTVAAQEIIQADESLITEDVSLIELTGDLMMESGKVSLKPTDCEYVKTGAIQLLLTKKGNKKWSKKLSKGSIDNSVVTGVFNNDVFEVSKIKTPYMLPEKLTKSVAVNNYIIGVYKVNDKLELAKKEASYVKVVSKEEEDIALGTVTANTYYNSECKELSEEELQVLQPKALAGLGKTLKITTKILVDKVLLSDLKEKADEGMKTLEGLDALAANKIYLKAQMVSSVLLLEVPKVASNAKKTKKMLKQLENE